MTVAVAQQQQQQQQQQQLRHQQQQQLLLQQLFRLVQTKFRLQTAHAMHNLV